MPSVMPLGVVTSSTLKVLGISGYYHVRGWVHSLLIPSEFGKFRVIADGVQIGNWAMGTWEAACVRNAPQHSPLFMQLIPKKHSSKFINFNAYKSIQIEFEEMPVKNDEILVKQVWVAPLNPKSKRLLYTHYFPPEVFVQHFDEIKSKDPFDFATLKVGRHILKHTTKQ